MSALLDQYQHPTGPPCFDSPDQYRSWRSAARDCYHLRATSEQPHFCTDCTPEYKARMQDAHRCVHPAVVFVKHPGEGVVGLRPEEVAIAARIEWAKEDRRLSAAVTAARSRAVRTQHEDDYTDLRIRRSALFMHRQTKPTTQE